MLERQNEKLALTEKLRSPDGKKEESQRSSSLEKAAPGLKVSDNSVAPHFPQRYTKPKKETVETYKPIGKINIEKWTDAQKRYPAITQQFVVENPRVEIDFSAVFSKY